MAKNSDVTVLDLAELFATEEHDELFMDDGIHFRQKGLERIGIVLYQKLCEMVVEGNITSQCL